MVFIFLTQTLAAQFSPDTKLKKVDTKHFEIIFPESMQGQVNAVGAQLDKSYEYINRSLGLKGDYKISIILNNKTAYSNGFITLGPEYGMFYTLPPQLDIHTLFYDDWIKLLAVHELRHAAQFHKLDHGFNSVLSFIFGDIGLAAGMGLSAPGWFFEGDAVYMETALTDFGRGRLASFPLLTRAMLLSGEIPDYAQMYLGSDLKKYPNIYEFGYLMNAWLRQQNGSDVYDKILDYSSSWNVLTGPYAFYLGMHNKTGKSLFQNYRELMAFLSDRWKSDLKNLTLTDYETVKTQKKEYYTDYDRPQSVLRTVSGGVLSDAPIYVYKSGLFHRGAIVKISTDGREKVIAFTGNLTGSISVNNKSIIWSEQEPDIRWSESKSVIKYYDLENKAIHKIKTNGRIFAPSLSADDKLVTAMQVDPNGDSWLVIFNKSSTDGAMIEKIKAPGQTLWQTPRFGNSSEKIALVESTAEGKSIITYDIGKKQFDKKLRPIKHSISDPFIHQNYILFHGDIKGIDNIFAIDILNGTIKQVTSVMLGAFYPHVSGDGKFVYFSNFSRLGQDVAKMPWQPEKWKAVNEKDIESPTLFQNTDSSKGDLKGSIYQNLPESHFNVTDYSSFANFLNFHSRTISAQDYLMRGNISVDLISSNKLQTDFVDLFYTYRTIENSHMGGASWTFMGWYPIISLGGSYGNRNGLDTEMNQYSWTEKNGNFSFALPFTISRGPFTQRIFVGTDMAAFTVSDFTSNRVAHNLTDADRYNADWFFSYNFNSAGNPRLFDNPYFNFGFFIYNTPQIAFFNKSGSSWDESVSVSFPGFFNNNVISIMSSGSQLTYDADPFYSNPGFLSFQETSLYKYSERYNVITGYDLPLFYPDFNIFHVLYMRRISINLFYEYIWIKPLLKNTFLKTNDLGGDLLLKFNIFELKSDITGGVRVVYNPQNNTIRLEPVLSLSIIAGF
jgi:hypothetical protein